MNNSSTPMPAHQLQDILSESPLHRLLGYKITESAPQHKSITISQAFSTTVDRGIDTKQFHGGAIAALIDVAAEFALLQILGFGVPTINLRIDYLRPAVDTCLHATATVRKSGRTIGVVDVDVIDDRGRSVAIGRGCYGTTPG